MGKKESIDKIPNDLQLEEAVLGALIIDKQDRYEALSLLTEGCFFDPVCRQIYQTIVELNREGDTIDMLTISNKLIDKINPSKLVELTMRVGSAAHVIDYSRKLYEFFMRREFLRIANRLQAKVYDYRADVERIVDEAQSDMLKLLKFDTANVATIDSVVEGVFDVMLRNLESDAPLSGIGTGLTELDKHSGGLQPTDLVVVAGETSQGKTSLALTIASNAALKYGAKVAFYSLEMGKTQLGARLMAQQTGVSSKAMLTHKLDRGLIPIINNNTYKLCNASIYFDDSSTTNIDSILRSIRAMKAKYGINLVVVDYLQLVSSSSKNTSREQQVAEVARSLKNIAKDLNICVIALSQLRRSENPVPTLSRLRDSGQIEEAADIVMFTYRPESYGKQYDEELRAYDPRGSALIDVAKGRNIGTHKFVLSFKKELTLYKDYDGQISESTEERKKEDW